MPSAMPSDDQMSAAPRAAAGAAGAEAFAQMTGNALFALARDPTIHGRRALFTTMQGLLLKQAPSRSGRERMLMGDILRRLVRDMEMALRKNLAELLAERPDMPHALVVELANDEIEVALPILVRSDALSDPDLVAVIRNRSAQHQLAVGGRKNVSEAVSEAIIEMGDTDVIESLLRNRGAKISRGSMEFLVDRSREIERFQGPLVERADLPADLAQRMYGWVSAALKEHIIQHHAIDREALDEALQEATAKTINDPAQLVESSSARDLAARLFELGELDGPYLARTLSEGDVALFEAALAQMCALGLGELRRIIRSSDGESLALLCKAVDLDEDSFASIARLLAKQGAGRLPTLEDASALVTTFKRTSRADAERVVKRWRRSAAYLGALDHRAGTA